MRFRNEYWFLSNMFECQIVYRGLTFRNVEAAFHAQKSEKDAVRFCSLDGFAAKKLGRTVCLRDDWAEVRIQLMSEIVYAKFMQNPALQELLLNTGNVPIVEENSWNDTFWGTCNGRGANNLGKILMNIRRDLAKTT